MTKNLFKLLLDNNLDGIIFLDNNFIITAISSNIEHMCGVEVKNLEKKQFSEFINKHITIKDCSSEDIIKNALKFSQDIMYEDSAGNLTPGILIIKKINSAGFFVFLRDDLQKQEFEHKIMRYKDRLDWINFEMQKLRIDEQKANYNKSMFLANMSHEIRTPLNGIIGTAELLFNTELDELQSKYLNRITNASEILLSIINQILDLSKIEAGQMHIDPIECDIYELIDKVSEIIRSKLKQDIKFSVNIAKNIPHLLIDNFRLKQILLNLLTNAVKFTDKGFITLDVKIAEKSQNIYNLQFDIIDSGIGIRPEKLKNLFSTFTQAESNTARQFGGTGLGLAICKELTELMQGAIDVKSTVNQGSKFSVKIPFKAA